ncbi:MAG: hypothetical protein NTY80_05090 [candidate division SR1 bacterium]|nr:hypothetical protein [candidate division SR1 bacterium]
MAVKNYVIPEEVDKLLELDKLLPPDTTPVDEKSEQEKLLTDLCRGFENILLDPKIALITKEANTPLLVAECQALNTDFHKSESYGLYIGSLGPSRPLCFYATFRRNEGESVFLITTTAGITVLLPEIKRFTVKEFSNRFKIPNYEDLYEKVNQALLLRYKDKIVGDTGNELKETLEK